MTATRSEDGKILVLHIVNIGSVSQHANITLANFEHVQPRADLWTLSGDLKAVNTPDAPEQIRSIHSTLETAAEHFGLTVAPYSYTVVRLKR